MRGNRALAILGLALLLTATVAGTSYARCGGACRDGRGMGNDGAPGMKPLFTTEQQEQIDKIRAKYDDQRVDLHNKMAALRLEMRDLLSQSEPDFGKVEARIDQISELRAKLAKMRLAQHRDVRGILTPEQRTLFDRAFTECCDGGPGSGMGCGPMGGGKAGCGPMGGMGGAQAGCGPMGAGRAGCGPAAAGCNPQTAGCGMMCRMAPGAGAPQAGAGGCPMAGAMGSGLGVRPQSGEWRRWL